MNILSALAKANEDRGALGRHTALLVSLIALLVAVPLLRNVPGAKLRFSILLSLVLTAAVYVNGRRRWTLVVAVLLGGGAIAGVALGEATGSTIARAVAVSLGLGMLGWTTVLMLSTLMRAEEVSHDTLIGGICVYLMVGVWFTMAFSLAILLDPGSLSQGELALGVLADDSSTRSAKLLYFSFVTLTTVGYGDITPVDETTQMMATAEALIGQLYIAIFIARLMALYVAGDRARRLERKSSERDRSD